MSRARPSGSPAGAYLRPDTTPPGWSGSPPTPGPGGRPGAYDLWHDRAVFHFLTDPADRAAYRATAARAVRPGGALVIGTFAAHGPAQCSGLPVCRYTPDRLIDELAHDFRPVSTHVENHHTPQGRDQPFTWAVLRRLGPRPERGRRRPRGGSRAERE